MRLHLTGCPTRERVPQRQEGTQTQESQGLEWQGHEGPRTPGAGGGGKEPPPPEPLRGSGRFGSPALAAGRSCRGRKWQKRLPGCALAGCALADRARPDWARRPVNTGVDR